MTMRLKLYTLLCISFLLIFTACNQDDDPVPAEKVTRTVLAYIMADNSLSGFASIDIDEMMKGMEAVDASLYNLLVYVDDASREGSQSYKFPIWGIERSGFFNDRGKWVKGFENQRV